MDRKKNAADVLFTLLIVGASLYPLYRDDIARLRMRAEAWWENRRGEGDALRQVQREISLMEHSDGA